MCQPLANPNPPAYWYSAVANFGDGLAPNLLKLVQPAFSHQLVTGETSGKLLSIGSNHHWIRPFDTVAGVGSMYPVRFRPANSVRIVSLRGPLTWELMGKPKIIGFGDPGLLAKKLVTEFRVEVGQDFEGSRDYAFVPHVSEVEHYRMHFPDVPVIDPRGDALEVCAQIGQFELIFSSSLHGLIVADSFGIPCVWIERQQKPAGTHKFLDYFLSVGRPKTLRPHRFSMHAPSHLRHTLPKARFSEDAIEQSLAFAVNEHAKQRDLAG